MCPITSPGSLPLRVPFSRDGIEPGSYSQKLWNAGEKVAYLSGLTKPEHTGWQAGERHANDDDSPNERRSASE